MRLDGDNKVERIGARRHSVLGPYGDGLSRGGVDFLRDGKVGEFELELLDFEHLSI